MQVVQLAREDRKEPLVWPFPSRKTAGGHRKVTTSSGECSPQLSRHLADGGVGPGQDEAQRI